MLILDADGKVIDRSNRSVDEIKRESYKHSSQKTLKEGSGEMDDFMDNLEELSPEEEFSDTEEGFDSEAEEELDVDAVEIAIKFMEFKASFMEAFGEEELQDAFLQFEDYFSGKGVDITKDLAELDGEEEVIEEEDIPGIKSSEQSIVTSEIE